MQLIRQRVEMLAILSRGYSNVLLNIILTYPKAKLRKYNKWSKS
jgi:hypothetical protein